MKKSDKKFEWTEEANTAFSQLKIALHTTSVGRTKRKGAITTIHRRNTSGGENGASSQMK
jgi:hypothetical protein